MDDFFIPKSEEEKYIYLMKAILENKELLLKIVPKEEPKKEPFGGPY